MFKNKFIKLLTATAFAVVGISTINTMSHISTVQASTFHYIRKDHKLVTLGYGQNLPLRLYRNGKHVYYNDDPKDEGNLTDENDLDPLKTHGWKYINGTKYYKIYNYFSDASAYINAKETVK
ncbi:hypothetical protein [Lactobacillus crispatus]|jgi:hypothetical protein|uniref:hypothetical protein n=1 Tax=Lactobacillus crispatus TaxID=47770 RepID=UPI001E542BFF|nr:hypothetical protein [Lactobacillus crispatus]